MRISIVTGVSRGLGAALFDQLHTRGDRVVGIGRSFTAAQHTLAAAEPERVVLHQADLAVPDSLPSGAELESLLAGGEHAALIHNAAMVQPIGAVGALPARALADAVAVNLTAPMLLTNAFLAALPATMPATILFLSSGAAHRRIDGWATYSSTKRAGESFFEAVAAQLADRSPAITVTSTNPGPMDTGMQASIRRSAEADSWFPGGRQFVGFHERGELPDPAQVAQRLIAEHLTEVTSQ